MRHCIRWAGKALGLLGAIAYASLSPFWECPSGLTDAVSKKPGQLRLQLVTPAHFSAGWKPGRPPEGATCTGRSPAITWNRHGPLLRLVSAITGRWQPISGFSLEKRDFGIKPVRRMVPAGSVYFFEIAESLTPKVMAEFVRAAWLQPIQMILKTSVTASASLSGASGTIIPEPPL